ncbi:MAG: VTT domain-containing protein [Fimbriimonadaceae bacterium]|nr:VTT domain-containing protein [Fimbriimonadaceae bacterium]
MKELLDLALHLDKHLSDLVEKFGTQIYWILALTLFVETGLVVTPFLPGDSLLFAAGLFSRPGTDGTEQLNVWILLLALPPACILGDMLNFQLGRLLGQKLFTEKSKGIFHRDNLAKTRAFFERHGGKAILIGRFVPIVRALAPFVAGMEGMQFRTFVPLSMVANVLWVWVCVGAGHIFGNIPWVREHFEIILLGLLVVMVVSIGLELRRDAKHRAKSETKDLAPDPVE